MADFVPVNDDHAVESVTFQLVFSQPFSPDCFNQLAAHHHLWKAELPAFDQGGNPPMVTFGTVSVPTFLSSVSFSHIRPDGSPAWQLRLDGPVLSVSCTRYTRWERVWGTALSLLRQAHGVLAAIPGVPQFVTGMLVVADAFSTSLVQYDVRDLLKPSRYLASHVTDAGPRWHNNLGWFENLGDEAATLHNLNVSSGIVTDAGEGTSHVRVQIAHHLELRLASAMDLAQLDLNEGGWLDCRMAELHLSNKRVVQELLTTSVAERIGLSGDAARA